MANSTVKLIIQMENLAKKQLDLLTQQLEKVRAISNQLDMALDSIDAKGLNQIHNVANQTNSDLLNVTNTSRVLNSTLNTLNSRQMRQVQSSAVQANSAFINALGNVRLLNSTLTSISSTGISQTTSNTRLLDTTLQATKGSANQLDNALDSINSSGMNQTITTSEMLRAILAVLIGIGQELKMILDSLANTGLDDAARDADLLKQKLIGAGDAGRNTQQSFKGIDDSSQKAGNSLGFLKNAASMAVGMIGFDLVNSMVQGARASINASASFERFGQRLEGMTSSKMQKFREDVKDLQNEFRKVDMNAVAASALEMGVKLKIPADSMKELTKTTAVMSSAFVKDGRTQEDAILAVSDAMDGEFRRLKELGITQDDLMKNGWDGDINNKTGLLQAMNKTLDKMGFTQTASEITTLDDAWNALTVTGSKLIASILVPITPLIIGLADGFQKLVDYVSNNGWAQGALLIGGVSLGILLLAGAAAVAETSIWGLVVSAMPGFITSLWSAATAMGAVTVAGAPLWAIVAVIAAIAFAVYEVGIAFGWWKDIGTMIAAITDGIKRLWAAFINNPNVKGFLTDLKNAWDAICTALQPVYNWAKQVWNELFPPGTKIDIVRMIIDAFGTLGNVISFIVRAISGTQSAIGTFIGFLGMLANPVGTVVAILRKVICILLGCSPGIVPALRKTQEVFSEVWNAIVGFLSGVISNVISALQPVIDILTQIGEYLINVFAPVWQLIVDILTIVYTNVLFLIDIFNQFLQGQISLPELLRGIWTILSSMFITILTTIINFVWEWGSQLIFSAINAASAFVNNIISFISSLPGRVYTFLLQVVARIISAGIQWVSNARNKAQAVVSGVMSFISQLPGKVYNEFMNIGNRILSAGSDLVNKAKKIGEDIVNGLLGAMGIHSPGIIQESVVAEFVNMLARVKNTGSTAYNYAKNVGKSLINGFKSEDIENALDVNITPNITNETNTMTSGNVSQNTNKDMGDDTGDSYYSLIDDVVFATDNINANNEGISESFSMLTSEIGNDTALIQSNVAGMVSSFQTTQLGVNTSLTNMTTSNNTAWNNIKSTTQSNLTQIRNSTANVTQSMINAWNNMKNNIVASASNIRNQSYNKFSSLHRSIASFYNQLANARFSSGLPAGPGNNNPSKVYIGRSSPIGGGINFGRTSKGSVNTGNYAGVLGQGKGKVIDTNSKTRRKQSKESNIYSNLLDYNLPTDIMEDIARLNGCVNPKTCFAGTVDTNVNKIINTAYPWKIADPWFLGIQIPSDFQVRDFKDGNQPTINPGNFESLLRKILTARGFQNPGTYEFYYNSKYSNQQVWDQVRCNCVDGAEMILEIASMLGLSGHTVHGSWNGIGHVAASIGGKIYDMTQFQKRGGIFRGGSGVSFGSSSSGTRSNDIFTRIFNKIDEIGGFIKNGATNFVFTNNSNNNENIVQYSNEDIHLTMDHNLNITITGDTENLDTKQLINSLRELITDNKLIDLIADALLKRDKKINRMGGI